MTLNWILCFFSLFAPIYGCAQDSLPSPYTEVELLPFDPEYEGEYGHAKVFSKLFSRNKVEVVIEVGSWLGKSTRYLATKVPENGKVYAVDHWLGSEEHQPGERNYTPLIYHLYQQFLSNVIHEGLTHKIIPVRMSSLEGAKYLSDIKPDLIYIDASHTTENVLADLRAWYPYVKNRGVLCGDDWTWPPVAAAVKQFAQEENLVLEVPSHNFWHLMEPSRQSATSVLHYRNY